jgi:DNA-directed RNA polymerase specialized sigma24 family protein
VPPSFEEFVAASTPRLVRTARMLLGSANEAEDMAQETLIVMHQHWGRLRNQDAADAYAYRTLVRLVRRYVRSARFRHESVADLDRASGIDVVDRQAIATGSYKPRWRSCRVVNVRRSCCATTWTSRSARPPA